MELHENIRVLRHPARTQFGGTFLWSHHEKIVVVDQKVAFIGGLDLCYGRWDINSHPLFDIDKKVFPGIDYSNCRVADFTEVQNYERDSIDRQKVPRMPWHDIALRVKGKAVLDISFHFMDVSFKIQLWNHVIADYVGETVQLKDKLQPLQIQKKQKRGLNNEGNPSFITESSSPKESQYISQFGQFGKRMEQQKEIQNSQRKERENLQQSQNLNELQNQNQETQEDPISFFPQQIEEKQSKGSKHQEDPLIQISQRSFSQRVQQDQLPARFQHLIEEEKLAKQKKELNSEKDLIQSQENQARPQDIYLKSTTMMFQQKENQVSSIQRMPRSYSQGGKQASTHIQKLMEQVIKNADDNQEEFKKEMLLQKASSKEKPKSYLVSNYQVGQTGFQGYKKNYKQFDQQNLNQVLEKIQNDNEVQEKLEKDEEDQEKKALLTETQDYEEYIQKNILQPRETLLPKPLELERKGSCTCQVVRSAGGWSYGLRNIECSIQLAYLQIIDQAEHFIYIENQFFISSILDRVKNKIVEAIYLKIKQAIEEQRKFYVMVVIPLLPAFEGNVQDPNSAVLRAQLHWEYSTICRGESSLLQKISRIPGITNPSDYIGFFGLRTHGKLNQDASPVTEIVYVHSKCMVVDDDFAIIGSANINDRSMMGGRDSEIAMVIEDQDKIPIKLAGEEKYVGRFARTLRMALCQEHLGVKENDQEYQYLQDPCSLNFIQLLQKRANKNTVIYRHVFRCYPDDEIASAQFMDKFQQQAKNEDYQRCQEIVGNIVEFPLKFLESDSLNLNVFNLKEFIVPEENFV